MNMGSAAWQGAHATCTHRPPGLISLTSSSLGVSRDKILMLQKSQANLSPGRSLKLKIRKTEFSCPTEL
jgi:hypothetical protein